MIEKLNNKDSGVASRIRDVFQISYAVEAKLLKAKEFPPLKRTVAEFIDCDNGFYGFIADKFLAAVIEIKADCESTHIQSLVVDPNFFRQGIGQKLLDFTFNTFNTILFTVETGAENPPAIALYEKNGFALIDEWMTEIGIRKVRFEKRITTTH
ncbi:GNAT family N-acetyltransferase [Maribacter sp. HTCC2170]|uniref:GNAT family N-acetyltransferase n=1 Tax=Maribacter sp. (strain HTCC2170 / KCCM 42371) TaxID=313603 RepID=UPI00006B2203|nr:N-acetyltransferase [Maribacter sp. HTCC2170]EAR00355.1 acetyltransferase, GNAT family protein [Maribacter sp. HTCC2170]